ncbi:hypothetical protein CAPTEDRAFT_190319 [Capitella teleta]|uniref:2'-phosphotransferase n=1 Tax=Capitella teleta TaxID=283909 RepID=R7V4H2_CAPTE|nr:hypothetical protein CAPTEDRAFT_190319 [Capitella teleta]|eukprot:ELU13733.1 hypothetical protein CAPTEDRAFT_190319 [Capitella teleta]
MALALNSLETINVEITPKPKWEVDKEQRLGKRLAYLLRYGAAKEGLDVSESGFVDFAKLMQVPMLRYYTPKETLDYIHNSVSDSGRHRFEKKVENQQVVVRAVYGRRMERNVIHKDTGVTRLVELCMDYVCQNLDSFDFSTFPDEFLVNSMIHKLRRRKKLNNRTFRHLLCPTIEHLDLGYVYLTENTLKLVASQCPHLRHLNLRECGYVITDHALSNLTKKLPHLETLNLACCHHLTDSTLRALSKNCKELSQINLTNVPLLTQQGILNMLSSLHKLKHLDIYDNTNISEEGINILTECMKVRGIVIVLKGLDCHESYQSIALPMASAGQFW